MPDLAPERAARDRFAREGPPVEQLLRRLADAPPDVLAEPRVGARGQVHVAAVAGDLLALLGTRPDAVLLAPLDPELAVAEDCNRLAVALLLCWLLADPWFAADRPDAAPVLRLLDAGARELAAAPARRYVEDPERREELARVALAALGLRPAGESPAQAEDRLTSVSAAERARVVAAAAAAERRARDIREALRRQAAQESADKYTRE